MIFATLTFESTAVDESRRKNSVAKQKQLRRKSPVKYDKACRQRSAEKRV